MSETESTTPQEATKTAAPKKVTVLPQWHAGLETATIENVSNLKQYDHGWLCTIIPTDDMPHGVLTILDITNRVQGDNSEPCCMNVGPSPDPKTEPVEICKALLATMMMPNPGNPVEWGMPRRPKWILLDKSLRPCLGLVTSILRTVDVVVKLNAPEALKADGSSKNGRKATWDAGLAKGATEENVKKLEQNSEHVWKCSMTMIQDPKSGHKECFLAVEEITDGTDEESSYALGVGPCPPVTVNPDGLVQALLATMLSPRAKEGGHDEGRRPGRVVLDKALEPWLEHIQSKTENIGITVEVES